jgi:hypothetical protein
MTRTYTPDRVTSEILDWFRVVDLDPTRILIGNPIEVDYDAGTVSVDYLERGEQGGIVLSGGNIALSRHTVHVEVGIPEFPEGC